MLINFAIGVATGIVREFQFGMNWSTYSSYVGDVFGAPLAIEGWPPSSSSPSSLAVDLRLGPAAKTGPPAMIWLAAPERLSAYFILVANSWMQRPVGYERT